MTDPLAWTEIIKIADPIAGTVLTRKIPGETYERLDSARFSLVTSAVVANRFVSADLVDGDGVVLVRMQSTTAITAGQTFHVTFVRETGLRGSGGTNEQLVTLPDIILPPGCSFSLAIGNIDVGDQVSEGRLIVTRYPSDQWVPSRGAIPYRS